MRIYKLLGRVIGSVNPLILENPLLPIVTKETGRVNNTMNPIQTENAV